MDNMLICGSCHTLVQTENLSITICPRCGDPLEPTAEDVLKRFIATGIIEVNRKGGTTLKEAQEAARAILEALYEAHDSLAHPRPDE